MDWVGEFYSRTGAWWGRAEARVTERDHRRVRVMRRVAGDGPLRVLELGSGYGTTAVTAVEDGCTVTAVEISDRARRTPTRPGLTLIAGSFYDAEIAGPFDVVSYWNGFGVGTDEDQRRLLRRVAAEWITADGVALIDVFNPFVWARWNDDRTHRKPDPGRGYDYELREETYFDPVTCTAFDTWWDVGRPDERITQELRCYSPADLVLLLEGTGLGLDGIVAGEERVPVSRRPGWAALLTEHWEYTAILAKA